jgi:anti-sigma B factor antagonist
MQSHFSVDVASRGDAAVISVSGELDLASSPALEEQLERVARSDASLVIVDLRALEFMDSTGLSVLVRAHQRSEENSQRFGLVNGSQQVQRLLTLTGVAERLTLEETPGELLGES